VSKVTSKLQVTIPKALAERYGIRPGDEIDWLPAGEAIRVLPARRAPALTVEERLRSFDEETRRLAQLQRDWPSDDSPKSRGWKREELYERGRTG
jgi:AbrB family looped-hinge helix DNA binding protein